LESLVNGTWATIRATTQASTRATTATWFVLSGTYRATVTAIDAAGPSSPSTSPALTIP
jgi:hypothetical protein